MVTRHELESYANRILHLAQSMLEMQGEFHPWFAMHYGGKGWDDIHFPDGAEHLMNSGEAKKIIFDWMRARVEHTRADGFLLASDTWVGKATEEGMRHVESGEYARNVDRGYRKLIQLGWARVTESIAITAQNEVEVLLIDQPYQRLGYVIQMDKCHRFWTPQAKYCGRSKMFGDFSEENLGENPADRT